ncbi:hypothetical protein [Bacillus safensis]|uniref:hypothetical protein n=2 Tax=Bacillus safensis TaxID=561879 RepID=UPI00339563FC
MDLFNLTHVGIMHNKANDFIHNIFPGLLDKVEYSLVDHIGANVLDHVEGHIDNEFSILGAYCPKTKKVFLCKRSTLKATLHEIGHAIHHQLLNYAPFVFSEEGKSERAEYNYKEDFAEAFAELIMKQNNEKYTKRDSEMKLILIAL